MDVVNEITRINRIRQVSYVLRYFLRIVNIFLWSVVFGSTWALIVGLDIYDQFALAFSLLAVFLIYVPLRFKGHITLKNLLLALEITYSDRNPSPLSGQANDQLAHQLDPSWLPVVVGHLNKLKKQEWASFKRPSFNFIAAVFALTILQMRPGTVASLAIDKVSKAVASMAWEVKLEIVAGKVLKSDPSEIALSRYKTQKISLLEQNLVRLHLRSSLVDSKEAPVVELRSTDDQKVFQRFKLLPVEVEGQKNFRYGQFTLSFEVSEPLMLYIPEYSSRPVVNFDVKVLPVPKVRLALAAPPQEYYSDEKPVNFHIQVDAQQDLQRVNLVIKQGKKVFYELVSNVMSENIKKIDTVYSLILKPYMNREVTQFEVYAEAIDRSLPEPLVGQSNVIVINGISSYGLYKKSLQKLRQVRDFFEQAQDSEQPKLDAQAGKVMDEAINLADQSAFYDAYGRSFLRDLQRRFKELIGHYDFARALDLREELNQFLLEHEEIDFRERDRDFFIAARALSRELEKPYATRQKHLPLMRDQILGFIDERAKIWDFRVKRVGADYIPDQGIASKKKREFRRAIQKIVDSGLDDKVENQAKAISLLTNLTRNYREWIDYLEEKEEKYKQDQEKKKRQGLASSRNQLRELQRRQEEISMKLDRANERSKTELRNNWPSVRALQKTNLRDVGSLEAKMRQYSPAAAYRIKVAKEMMEKVVQSGEQSAFVKAESASDAARRLLQQADSAARRQQNQRRNTGRRRRLSGDDYYGNTVVGRNASDGDVEIRYDYKVDEQYRDVILNEVLEDGTDSSAVDKELLENYLREVVR